MPQALDVLNAEFPDRTQSPVPLVQSIPSPHVRTEGELNLISYGGVDPIPNNRPRRIWLSRHGESMANQKDVIGTNSQLSPKGLLYAKELPKELQSRIALLDNQGGLGQVVLASSCLDRAVQTALPLAELLDVQLQKVEALNELEAGDLEGLSYGEIEARFPEEHKSRKKDKLRYRYPKGESYEDLMKRVRPVVEKLENGGIADTVVVIAHQAVLRCVLAHLLREPEESVPVYPVRQHALMELTPQPGGGWALEIFPVALNC